MRSAIATYLASLTQTLTNKTINTASNTITVVEADISDLGTYQAQLAEGAFVDGDKTKLDGIETAADVTDATNVNAAGATMNTDTDVSSNSWVLDEDNMASDDATKVPTQQSVKAYVDTNAGGDLVVFRDGHSGDAQSNTSTTRLSLASGFGLPCMSFSDAATGLANWHCKVPSGATSISSIKVLYANESTSTDLYLKFVTSHVDTDAAEGVETIDATDTESTYTTGSTASRWNVITVPAAAYDGLTVDADDIIGLRVQRTGGDASDTYNAAWLVAGIIFTFA